MILCRICCDICCARGPHQGPRGPYQGPPRTIPGPSRTSIPPHIRGPQSKDPRGPSAREGSFQFFLFLLEGAPLGTSPPAIPHLRYLRYGRYAPAYSTVHPERHSEIL